MDLHVILGDHEVGLVEPDLEVVAPQRDDMAQLPQPWSLCQLFLKQQTGGNNKVDKDWAATGTLTTFMLANS